MNPIRKRKLIRVLFVLLVTAIVTALVTYALRQNISLFFTPTQFANGEAPMKQNIRLGGMVVKDSVVRVSNDLSVEFQLTDFRQAVSVSYRGILPDLFREGQGIVASGVMIDKTHFKADEVLAKHDANYMPPEVKDALAKAAQTRGKAG